MLCANQLTVAFSLPRSSAPISKHRYHQYSRRRETIPLVRLYLYDTVQHFDEAIQATKRFAESQSRYSRTDTAPRTYTN